ncbi:DOLPP1 isoform 4, partial [Pan troglodytes]
DGQCSLPASWRPVTLTHVEYPAGDLSGHLLAYLSLSPVFVIVGFVTLIIFKRELHTAPTQQWAPSTGCPPAIPSLCGSSPSIPSFSCI